MDRFTPRNTRSQTFIQGGRKSKGQIDHELEEMTLVLELRIFWKLIHHVA